ncbi:hypothetical protein CJJ23_02900 [Mycoplasmopsis agassizii]|uniref:NERD domain-containing protein n=2 Tax=Mycoplasmopsis agassizii TaxID=33922 RepID=A0A269TIN7_9BACT|nr:hypothetical protein CJJ23_02900 [Mycoplasmopsis agassizii]
MFNYILGIGLGLGSLLVIFIIIFAFWLSARLRKSKTKKIGYAFEKRVEKLITTWVGDKNKLFHPASIYSYDDDKYFEVDGILITARAILVLELKSINGKITGKADEPIWTKQIGNKIHDIKNPIIQNDKHIEHILKMLNVKLPMLSVIVFDSKAEDVKIIDQPSHVVVTNEKNLTNILDEMDNFLNIKLNNSEMTYISDLLNKHKSNKKEDKKIHSSYTRQKQI